MKSIKNRNGLTLVEIIIVIAIIGILSAVASSVFFSGTKSFEFSKDKGFAQQEARLAATIITRELRTAVEWSVNADSASMADAGFKKIDKDSFDNVSSISFSSEGNNILLVKLTAEETNANQNIEFKVLLENSQDLSVFGSEKNAVYYKKY